MKIVSMEFTPAEAKAETVEAQEIEAPKYPWGLSLNLDEETLAKLGLDKIDVGTIVSLAGKAKVTGYSEREYEGGAHKCLDLQITDLGLDKPAKSVADTLYGGNKA